MDDPAVTDLASTRAHAGVMIARAAIVVGLADLVAVLALFLPWAFTGSVFRGAGYLAVPVVVVVVAAIAAHALAAAAAIVRPEPRTALVLAATLVVGVVAAAIAAGLATTDFSTGPSRRVALAGPLTAAAAGLVDLAVAAVVVRAFRRPVRDGDRSHHSPVIYLVGFTGLVLAGVGLLDGWQWIAGPGMAGVTRDGGPASWRAPELDATFALRVITIAALAITAAAILLAVIGEASDDLALAGRRLRPAVGVVLVIAGLAVAGAVIQQIATMTVHGLAVSVEPGPGAWLALAGGVVTAVCGLLAFGRPRMPRRRVTTAAAAAALLVVSTATVARPVHAEASAAAPTVRVLGADRRHAELRVGAPTGSASFDLADAQHANAAADEHGTLFVTSSPDPTRTIIEEVRSGRLLPVVTMVHQPSPGDPPLLLAMRGGAAIIDTGTDYYLVRLDHPVATLGDVVTTAPDPTPAPLVLSPSSAPRAARGQYTSVTTTPSGGLVVSLLTAQYGPRSWLVTAREAVSGHPWSLTQRLRPTSIYSPVYDSSGRAVGLPQPGDSRFSELLRQTAGGTATLIGTPDAACTPSRDPLRTYLRAAGGVTDYAVDGAGDVWVALAEPSSNSGTLWVLTPDGVLRRVPVANGRGIGNVTIGPDGALYLTLRGTFFGGNQGDTDAYQIYQVGETLRLPQAARAAAMADPLPPPTVGCAGARRQYPRTLGKSVTTLARGLPSGAADSGAIPLDARGTYLTDEAGGSPTTSTVTVHRPGHSQRVRRSEDAVFGLAPDGLGGAWWIEEPMYGGQARILHLDRAGQVRVVKDDNSLSHGVSDPGPSSDTGYSDPRSHTYYWNDGQMFDSLQVGGAVPPFFDLDEDSPVAGSPGRGYLANEDSVITRWPRDDFYANAVPVLGADATAQRRLPLQAVAAARLPPTDVDVTDVPGSAAIDTNGRLLYSQGGWLARLDADRFLLLAGPKQGLGEASYMVTFGAKLMMVTGDGRVQRVSLG